MTNWYVLIVGGIMIGVLGMTALLLGSFLWTLIAGAPHVAIDRARLKRIIADLHLTKHDTVVDLGAGTATFVRAAAGQCKQVIGYEINPLLAIWSRWRLRRHPNAHILNRSLFHADLKGATVIYLYLFPPLMPRVTRFLRENAQPGARILSVGFQLSAWKPVSQRDSVYMYQVKGGDDE